MAAYTELSFYPADGCAAKAVFQTNPEIAAYHCRVEITDMNITGTQGNRHKTRVYRPGDILNGRVWVITGICQFIQVQNKLFKFIAGSLQPRQLLAIGPAALNYFHGHVIFFLNKFYLHKAAGLRHRIFFAGAAKNQE